ncbi:MAG: DUF805 domain-containing protein [Flavobacteriaceae bacterium]|jgi:uncharacterized membrane protein YhaH (DUF805 family)|nr:DUF805 domain-containing protein [Flavobacteriaceae bacterium]
MKIKKETTKETEKKVAENSNDVFPTVKTNNRMSRGVYWREIIKHCVILIVGLLLLMILSSLFHTPVLFFIISISLCIYVFYVFVHTLDMSIKRMHDVDKSGLYILIPVYNLILTLKRGTPGKNRYDGNYGISKKTQEISDFILTIVIMIPLISAFITCGLYSLFSILYSLYFDEILFVLILIFINLCITVLYIIDKMIKLKEKK